MSTIEEKIQAGEYSSMSTANAAIKRSKLPKGERKRLTAMISEHYPQTKPVARTQHPKLDPLDTPVQFAGTEPSKQLSHELTALALRVMSVAVKHKLSRQQVFDLLKERTIVEG